jgi:hypothetical protein
MPCEFNSFDTRMASSIVSPAMYFLEKIQISFFGIYGSIPAISLFIIGFQLLMKLFYEKKDPLSISGIKTP